MAETKVNPRIKEEPKVLPETKTFNLSAEDLQNMVAAAVKGALDSQPRTAAPAGPDLNMALQNQLNQRLKDAARFNQELYESKDYKTLVIDEIYVEYVGKFITSTVNSSTVKVPVDGRPYLVHPAHYRAIRERLMNVSKQRRRNAGVSTDFGGSDTGDFSKV